MATETTRPMTRSALAIAKMALRVGRKVLPAYSHANSPKVFTQPQLFAMLAIRQFFGLDYRGTEQLLADWSDLRRTLRLKQVPHWTTLQKADDRLLKKGVLIASWMARSPLRTLMA
jgi:hypothetical protein